ncbi:MAG: Hdr-like menaquinol oxidoreductase cytochrome c subunit [Pseudomonadota bacterium]
MTRIAAGILAALLAAAALAEVVKPTVRIEKGGACVAPVEQMRRNHMTMLFHQRDRTLREGIRAARFSLQNCIDCHASAKTGSVLGKEGFCSSCHAYAAVKMDCFECHTPMRQAGFSSRGP